MLLNYRILNLSVSGISHELIVSRLNKKFPLNDIRDLEAVSYKMNVMIPLRVLIRIPVRIDVYNVNGNTSFECYADLMKLFLIFFIAAFLTIGLLYKALDYQSLIPSLYVAGLSIAFFIISVKSLKLDVEKRIMKVLKVD